MTKQLFALLIHGGSDHFECLREALKRHSVHTYSVSTCKQAENLLAQCKPDLVFTESSVTDGSWLSIQNLAEAARMPLSVIVVGSLPNTQLYISVMELGAFDFIAPPFERDSLDFIVQSAARNTHRLRKAVVDSAAA